MKFLNSGNAPLLFEHDVSKQIGVIEKAFIKDKRGFATVRFGRSPFAEKVFEWVTSGRLKGVSKGLDMDKMFWEESLGAYRVTKWFPYEISLTESPADPNAFIIDLTR